MFKKAIIKLFLLFLFIQLTGVSCNNKSSNPEINRPTENWVFRSVLDKKSRIATVALNKNMWLAYNTQTATLYKAWKGGVDFDGAVYTTRHGPQPTSLGYAYYAHNEAWVLFDNEKEIKPKVQYKGHRFENGEVIFKFLLETPDNKKIEVQESPIYLSKEGKNGVERHFKVTNNTSYTVGLKTVIPSLESENDFATNGTFTETNRELISFDDGKVTDIQGTLKLNNLKTKLSIFFHPGFDKINRNKTASKKEKKKKPTGAILIEANDCVACHNETEKTIGPAYLTIAEKYADDQATVKKLMDKIKKGGQGVWGDAIMTPHPNLSEDQLKSMVSYILKLDDNSKKGKTGAKYTLNIKSNLLDFKTETSPNSGKGLVANLYVRDPENKKAYTKKPIKNAVSKSIHTLKPSDFGAHNTNIKIIFQGEINIKKTDSYDFRLISDDGSFLFIDGKEVIDNGGNHAFTAVDGETYLKKGKHRIKILFEQGGGGGGISLQWFNKTSKKFELITDKYLSYSQKDFQKTIPFVPKVNKINPKIAGDQAPLKGVHPSFNLYQARPESFKPRVGGLDFISDNMLVVSTWDADGSVYLVKNYSAENPSDIKVKRIATGLAEPLGVKVVEGDIYVLQKQELTKLIDHDGDEIIDEYETISNDWKVSSNFHEFAFGLIFKDGYFYATLATAILPGGASANPQIPDRGKVVKISLKDGSAEFEAFGLRTPNGIGMNLDKEIFVADNQGDWLPASKIVHIQKGKFYGSHSVDPIGTKDLEEKLPVVWLPQNEIGNSPSTPTYLNIGPYKNQLIHGEVTHGGIKRVAYEEVEGQLQGAVFRFTQGLEAGVNRICWAPDGSLLVGGIGVSGNWGQQGKLGHGLQRLKYNGTSTFEMLKISALSDGFEIEFTEPLADDIQLSSKEISIEQWYYKPTKQYGGPKIDLEKLMIQKITLSKDRKKVVLSIKNLKEKHVVYFHLNNSLRSNTKKELWTTEAWYTLNKIPKK